MNKCLSNIQCQDSNSQPLEHESHTITTRPEPALLLDFYVLNGDWFLSDKQSDDEIITTKTILSILYKTLLVEERVETLIYDAGSFLAAAGGNLAVLRVLLQNGGDAQIGDKVQAEQICNTYIL